MHGASSNLALAQLMQCINTLRAGLRYICTQILA